MMDDLPSIDARCNTVQPSYEEMNIGEARPESLTRRLLTPKSWFARCGLDPKIARIRGTAPQRTASNISEAIELPIDWDSCTLHGLVHSGLLARKESPSVQNFYPSLGVELFLKDSGFHCI
eukprot:c7870_g1_i1.p1 GENE.c7870_g1_i1~~c7870_g1_i1.p1  ORF type:complete len:121 (-),score=4.82 c7870_g1_i1:44-406(-)